MAARSQTDNLVSTVLANVDKLRNVLKSSHPDNVLMPGRIGKHPNGDPFKGPQFAHKNGDWTWQKSDAVQWSKVNMFGLLLKTLIVIDIDGKSFLDFYENHFPCLQHCPKENTKKGGHYFFQRTSLCDTRKLYDGARALKSDSLPAEENGVLPIDIKTVCSTGTCGFLVVTPSTDKSWVHGREPWSVTIPPIPDDFVETLVALKDSPFRADSSSKRPSRPERSVSSACIDIASDRFAPSWDEFELAIRGLNLARHFGSHTYQMWTSLGWAMDNVGRTGGYRKRARGLFDEISREFPNYNKDSVLELFYKVRDEGRLLGFRYIFDRLREDNPELHRRLKTMENSNISLANSSLHMSPHTGFLEDTATSDAAPTPLVAPGKDYNAVKAEFEKEWFALSFPAMFVQIKYGAIRLMNFTSAKHNANNITFEEIVTVSGRKQVSEPRFFSRWAADTGHRRYDSMDFLPPPMVCRDDVYNTFSGIRAASLPDVIGERDLSPILDLMFDLCDRDEASRQYILHFMAHLVQMPGRLPGTGIIMKSKQGRGKNTLWGTFFAHKILGEELYHSSANPDHFFGRFANGMVNKLLTNFNEIQSSQTNKIMGLVKEAITEPFLNYEKKGLDVVKVHNFARQVWFSNEIMPIMIAQDDRRWVAVEASKEMPEIGTHEHSEYFRRIHCWIADEQNVRAFYDMLMAMDLSIWDAERDRPRTSFYTNLQQLSLNRVDQWFVTEIEHNTLPARIHSKELLSEINSSVSGTTGMTLGFFKQLLQPYIRSGSVQKLENFRIGSKTGNGYGLHPDKIKDFLVSENKMRPLFLDE